MTLSVLSSVRQVFYRMSFSLSLCPLLLMKRLGLWDLGDAQAFPDTSLLIMFQQTWHECGLDLSDSLQPRGLTPARLLCPWDSGWEVEMCELAVSGVLNGKTRRSRRSEALEKEAGGGRDTLSHAVVRPARG